MAELRVVIVGRPNVGKSTLFNRLYGRRRALVHDEPGVTRDRLEEKTTWHRDGAPISVRLVDTGGLGGDRFAEEIDFQVHTALENADVVLMIFDGQTGLTPQDREVVRGLLGSELKQRGVPIIGVINKVDAEVHETMIHDFYSIKIDPLLTVSAEHGRGIDDLKTAIFEAAGDKVPDAVAAEADLFEDDSEGDPEGLESTPRIAIVGKPNAGKSTLVNALLGERRMITSPIAGTTVDAVDSVAMLGDRPYVLIDTAGIRRKSKTERGVEVLSVVQARKALERCDVAVLMLDGEGGITDQDEKIGGLIEEVGCGVILVMNKWDTQKGSDFTQEMAAELVRKKMAFLRYAPLMFISAKERRGLGDLPDLVDEILVQRRLKLSTREFSEWVRDKSRIHNPENVKFYMSHQSGRNPPTFVCHVSDPNRVHFSLQRHMLNGIRERWGYMGSPVRLLFVKGGTLKSKVAPKRRTPEEKAAAAAKMQRAATSFKLSKPTRRGKPDRHGMPSPVKKRDRPPAKSTR